MYNVDVNLAVLLFLQIAGVICRVVFFLFLLCFQTVDCLFLFCKICRMRETFRHCNLVPRASQIPSLFWHLFNIIDVIFRILQLFWFGEIFCMDDKYH